MKVVLIEVTSDYYRKNPLSQMARVLEPLAIESIGGYLEQYKHEVILIHQLDMDNDALVARIVAEKPDLVGLSCMTYSFPGAQALALSVKRELPKTALVLGGYHVLGLDECPDGFDFVVKGEGEVPCRDILDFLCDRILNVAGIPGLIFYRDPATGRSRPGKDINHDRQLPNFPWPMRLDRQRYFSMSMGENLPHTRLACVVVGRGCPYRCDFCCTPVLFHGRHICRSIPDVVREIQWLQAKHGVNTINVRDETFSPQTTVLKFCKELLEQNVRVQWRAFATVGSLNREAVQMMASAGCHMLFYGIEASDPETLRLRRKSFAAHIDQVPIDIANAQDAGIFVRAGFIAGHETDTEESFARHLTFLKHIHPDELYISFLTPFPGTPLYRRAVERGDLMTENLREYDCEHPVLRTRIPRDTLARLRMSLYEGFYDSTEWRNHLKKRVARRPQEQATVERFTRFAHEHLGLQAPFSAWNGA